MTIDRPTCGEVLEYKIKRECAVGSESIYRCIRPENHEGYHEVRHGIWTISWKTQSKNDDNHDIH